jgi:hypothetical protein
MRTWSKSSQLENTKTFQGRLSPIAGHAGMWKVGFFRPSDPPNYSLRGAQCIFISDKFGVGRQEGMQYLGNLGNLGIQGTFSRATETAC